MAEQIEPTKKLSLVGMDLEHARIDSIIKTTTKP